MVKALEISESNQSLRIDQIVSLRVVALSLLPVEGSTLATK